MPVSQHAYQGPETWIIAFIKIIYTCTFLAIVFQNVCCEKVMITTQRRKLIVLDSTCNGTVIPKHTPYNNPPLKRHCLLFLQVVI